MTDEATEAGDSVALVGWCPEHEIPAMLYDDGSLTCMHALIVESTSSDCSVVPIPPERLLTGSSDPAAKA